MIISVLPRFFMNHSVDVYSDLFHLLLHVPSDVMIVMYNGIIKVSFSALTLLVGSQGHPAHKTCGIYLCKVFFGNKWRKITEENRLTHVYLEKRPLKWR